jgi:hypothetical protein
MVSLLLIKPVGSTLLHLMAAMLLLLASVAPHAQTMAECAQNWDFRAFSERIAEARDIDALVVSAMVNRRMPAVDDAVLPSDDQPNPILYLERASTIEPDNQLLLKTSAWLCRLEPYASHPYCEREFERRLVELDPGNGLNHVLLALWQHESGHPDSALSTLREAASATRYDTGWVKVIVALKQQIERYSPEVTNCAAVVATGVAAAYLPRDHHIAEVCQSEMKNPAWLSVCSSVATLMDQRGQTLMTKMLGVALQKLLLKPGGDRVALEKVTEREAALDRAMQDYARAEDCILSSAAGADAWFANLRELGEAELVRRVSAGDMGSCDTP